MLCICICICIYEDHYHISFKEYIRNQHNMWSYYW
jgi:hypothetical protein